MKTICINLYEFVELSEPAKHKALNELRTLNVAGRWWRSTCDEAQNIGLNIHVFDVEGKPMAGGDFIGTPHETAHKIIENHGRGTPTALAALTFIKNDDLDDAFKQDILDEYAKMLKAEYEFLLTDQAIIETIQENGYTFEESGKMNNTK